MEWFKRTETLDLSWSLWFWIFQVSIKQVSDRSSSFVFIVFDVLVYWELFLLVLNYTSLKVHTIFAWLRAPCGCKLGNFSVAGVLSNICITAPPNECRSHSELNAAFQTRQEERYVIWFGILLRGNLTWGDDLWHLLVPQNRRKIGGGCAYSRQWA